MENGSDNNLENSDEQIIKDAGSPDAAPGAGYPADGGELPAGHADGGRGQEKTKKASELIAWIRDIAIAIIIALVISRFITPTIVQEHSMDDTLHNNDYLILWKMAYVFGEPDYGDIVVFRSDLLNEKGENKLLIKRVVAKGGDTIELHDGYVYRNGQQLTETYTKDGYTHGYIEATVIPEGQLFLLGDNRAVSVDSRDPAVGFVDEELLEGKAVLRLYPFDQMGGLYKDLDAE